MNKENLKGPRPLKIDYRDQKCLICKKAHVVSLLVAMQEITFVLCKHCAETLSEYLGDL